MALRLVFMGTPDFAVPTLVELIGGGHDIAAVYTRAPQPAGRRGLETTPSPIAREAERLKLSVLTPKTLKDDGAADAMRAHGADAAVVVAYGLILPKAILDCFPLGCFNLHASLLPRWRGAAPIHRAIMAGDKETGVMVMRMEVGLDTGPVAMAERLPIAPDATTGELHDKLARLGADLMLRALGALERGGLQLTPQAETGVTYARKIDKNETRIDWAKPWSEVHDHCRGLSPFPGAWCELPGTGRVKILHSTKGKGSGESGRVLDDKLTVACGSGAVRIVELQRAGGKPMAAEEFLRGTPIAPASVPLMPRYKLTIEYDGGPYVGWQMQDNGATIQGALTAAIEAFTGERVAVNGAGRTDAGVHALGQVAHINLAKEWDSDNVRDAMNFHLRPQPVAVLTAERAADDFDARFSAVKRHYLYRIVNRRADLALEQERAWRVPRKLDTDAMHAAAQRLTGKHDFTTFRSTECQAKSPVKTLDRLGVTRDGDDVRIIASARSFLQHQVRSMVGSLVHVGEGKWTANDLVKALEARDRAACGQVAPPHALYLVRVDY